MTREKVTSEPLWKGSLIRRFPVRPFIKRVWKIISHVRWQRRCETCQCTKVLMAKDELVSCIFSALDGLPIMCFSTFSGIWWGACRPTSLSSRQTAIRLCNNKTGGLHIFCLTHLYIRMCCPQVWFYPEIFWCIVDSCILYLHHIFCGHPSTRVNKDNYHVDHGYSWTCTKYLANGKKKWTA